jgi:hypothetical protein
MTEDEIIKLAQETNVYVRGYYDESGSTPQELKRFAILVAAKEREGCAKLCEEQYEYYGFDHVFAAKIRARSNHG